MITRKILVYGSGSNPPFIKYAAALTNKALPRLCYLPTATGDNPYLINNWYSLCAALDVKAFVQRMFISSYEQTLSFEETLLSMDAIIVGGGNTLNMLAIWKAQGIDTALRKAYDAGIILAGGSAG